MSESNHQKTVIQAGAVAIAINLLLAVFKVTIGILSNSIAIMSDALHGLVDAFSGIVVIVSEKLGSSQKNRKSHEEIEHIGSIVIAIIILAVGIHIITESIEKLSRSDAPEYSVPVIVVLIASIIGKLLLGLYLRRTGQKVESDTLIASSVETINDSLISGAVLFSALIYLIWHVDIEAQISLIIALIIIKLGLELIFPKFFKHHHRH